MGRFETRDEYRLTLGGVMGIMGLYGEAAVNGRGRSNRDVDYGNGNNEQVFSDDFVDFLFDGIRDGYVGC